MSGASSGHLHHRHHWHAPTGSAAFRPALHTTGMTRNQRYEPAPAVHPAQTHTLSNQRQSERAFRDAYRREKKIESYLADDENFPCFAHQLRKLGLQLRDIPADGNCLFRALGDQFEGHSRNHYRHRQEVGKYMTDYRKDFEPFVEDDVPFDHHVNVLKKLGTHAGNDAIVAFAKLHAVNILIHQLNGKPLLIQGAPGSEGVRQLHIAYHNGDHYSSIRRDGDNTESPANIRLQDDSTSAPPVSGAQHYAGMGGVVMAKRGLDHLEAEVMRATGCQDAQYVRETLQDCDYDVDASIATLLQTIELGDGTQSREDTTSLCSQHTADSGIWASDGTGNRIFGGEVSCGDSLSGGGQKVHFREDSYGGSSGYSSLGSNRGSGARPKLAMPAYHYPHHSTDGHKRCPCHNGTRHNKLGQGQHKAVSGRKLKEVRKMEKKQRATERHQIRAMTSSDPRQLGSDNAVVIPHTITRI